MDGAVELAPLAEEVRPLIVQIPRKNYSGEFALTVRLADEAGTFYLERPVRFVGPDKQLLDEDAKERASAKLKESQP